MRLARLAFAFAFAAVGCKDDRDNSRYAQSVDELPAPAAPEVKPDVPFKSEAGVEVIPDAMLAVPNSVKLSPDSTAYAFVVRAGARVQVAVNGERLPRLFDSVDASSITFTGDGKHLAFAATGASEAFVIVDGVAGKPYEGIARTTLHWNKDGTRLAYAGVRGGAHFAVVDGVEYGPYQVVGQNTPVFSADGRVGWFAKRDGRWLIAVDGVETPAYDGVGEGGPHFSPSGKRMAYMSFDAGVSRVVVDGKPGRKVAKLWTQGITFRPGDEKVAYAAEIKPGQWAVIVGGAIMARHPWVFDIHFDRSGGNMLYLAGTGTEQFAVWNGAAQPKFVGLGGGVVSPVGGRYAYAARTGPKWRVVLDGAPQPEHDEIAKGTMKFSPDGKRFAYIARDGVSWFVIVDGERSPPTAGVVENGLAFSADGNSVAYAAVDPSRRVSVVTGDRKSTAWNTVAFGSRGLRFGPSGKLHYIAAVGAFMVKVEQPAR